MLFLLCKDDCHPMLPPAKSLHSL